jgi:hypothetical protein
MDSGKIDTNPTSIRVYSAKTLPESFFHRMYPLMNSYLIIVLCLLIGFTLFHMWIEWLNLSALKPEIPSEFEGVYDAEKYAKSQAYLRENTRVDMVTGVL